MAKKKSTAKPSVEKKSKPAKKPSKRQIEQYDHADEKRPNNPPVGLVTPDTDPDSGRKTYQYDPHLDPQLVWAGKAEHTSFEVPTVSLHVHERIDPKTIIQAVRKVNGNGIGSLPLAGRAGEGGARQQAFLFEQPEQNPPIRDAVEFYQHQHNWSNRLIAGDSLLVMNSLLEKEGLAGKVQMVYLDPPYGIRYGSNFQPFTNRRDVKDGRDEDLTQEPETIRAFRDTWELGIHSYLTYLRDRLLLARELLHESGSIFVQINDENVHRVRDLMDEVFQPENFVSLITFQTTSGFATSTLSTLGDFLLWYAKHKPALKVRKLYEDQETVPGQGNARWVLLDDGSYRGVSAAEKRRQQPVPNHATLYKPGDLQSQGAASEPQPFEYDGTVYTPAPNSHWKANYPEGMESLATAGRVHVAKNSIQYRRFADDFPFTERGNIWIDTSTGSFTDEKLYAVQTNVKVIERCILLSTDPGDLVFDPTCGSGTTAYVAEQWGRRWITCDTSRVAVTLAKQRLMTAHDFKYYQLAHPDEGVGSGFKYKTVPHVTLKSIANNPEIKPGMTRAAIDAAIAKYADQETLYDQPLIDRTKARVTGPFTVEAVPAATVMPLDDVDGSPQRKQGTPTTDNANASPLLALRAPNNDVARRGETVRQSEWRDELLKTGIRGRGGQRIEFSRVEVLGGTRWLHADAETKSPVAASLRDAKAVSEKLPHSGDANSSLGETCPQRAVISFGPEHAPLEQKQVARALDEAESLRPKPKLVIFAAFQFDPEAAKDIDETNWPGVTLLKAQMNADLLTDDLKKKRISNDSYWLIGQPDVEVTQLPPRAASSPTAALYQITIHGFDYYNTRTGAIDSGDTTRIAMWLLDTDYDGRSIYPRQVFFPMAGEKDGWARLAKNLKAEIDEDLIEEYRGTTSLPFEAGTHGRVAVKIVDDRGIESLRIMGLE
ncbi:MAG: site-specific DNA-methyltransferase [Pirellulales bacterium]